MARACSVCNHASRSAIDAALIAGKSNREITRTFGVSKDAQWRHKMKCIPGTIQVARDSAQEMAGIDVAKQLGEANTLVRKIARESGEDSARYELALKAIDRQMKQIEFQAKIEGLLETQPQVNVFLDPQWIELREAIFQALLPYPDARIAVAGALYNLEKRTMPGQS